MRSSSRNSCHVILLEPVQPTSFLILSYFPLRTQLGIIPLLPAIRLRWAGFLPADGTACGRGVHRGRLPAPLAQMDHLVRLLACGDRGGEQSERPADRGVL